MSEKKKLNIKGLLSYISKRKKPWSVAVFDKKTGKRAVGDSMAEVMEKLPNPSEDVVVINNQEFTAQTKEDERERL